MTDSMMNDDHLKQLLVHDDVIEADAQIPHLFDRGIPDLLAYSDCFDLPRGSEVKAAQLLVLK